MSEENKNESVTAQEVTDTPAEKKAAFRSWRLSATPTPENRL